MQPPAKDESELWNPLASDGACKASLELSFNNASLVTSTPLRMTSRLHAYGWFHSSVYSALRKKREDPPLFAVSSSSIDWRSVQGARIEQLKTYSPSTRTSSHSSERRFDSFLASQKDPENPNEAPF